MAEIANCTSPRSMDQPTTRWQRLTQSIVIDRLSRLARGRLTVVLSDGEVLTFGRSGPEATLHVHDPAFFTRLIASADVGAGESYMAGEWSTPDLVGLTRLFLENESIFDPHPVMGFFKRLGDRFVHLARSNTTRRAPRNIAAHYDLSNQFYALFLDSSMTYSSAYFRSRGDTLRKAQENKFLVLADKAGVAAGDHILEIGCGWGGFAEFAARDLGCRVTAITLSEAQAAFSHQRIRQAGLEDLVEIRVQDYRNVGGTYDAVISIEMLEAVGHGFLGSFFATCNRVLKVEGRAAVQVITMPDQLYETYRRGSDFIRRHIFPGGHLPSLHAMQNAIVKHSSLVVQDVENIAAHYAETLSRWRVKFMSRLTEVESLGFDDRFIRMWEFYLATCEAAFDRGKLGTLQLVLARPGGGSARGIVSSRSVTVG